MSTSHDESPRRGMTRSEFLGVGLAAGAATACGAPPERLVASLAPERRAQAQDCTGELSWAIAVRHLSVLWSDLLPRVVAANWAGNALATYYDSNDLEPYPVPQIPDQDATGVDMKERIGEWIEWALTAQANGQSLGSEYFQKRVQMLSNYWTRYADLNGRDRRPPIVLRAEGGFDFYVSDQGIDLYIPEYEARHRRSTLDLLLFLFTMRDTGQSVLGTPGLNSKYIMPAKRGASQLASLGVETSELMAQSLPSVLGNLPWNVCGYRAGVMRRLDEAFRPVHFTGEPHPGGIDHQHVPNQAGLAGAVRARQARIDSVLESAAPGFPAFARVVLDAWTAWQNGLADGRDLALQRQAWWPEGRDAVLRILGEEGPECTPVTDHEVMCEIGAQRCWQLEGSVLRGIAEQHPRVVAQAWFEQLDASGELPDPLREIQYRQEMMDRLETALPPKMFCAVDAVAGPQWFQEIVGPELDEWAGELTVSNHGLHFPAVSPPGHPGDAASQFLVEVVHGRAGNPVFTDSRVSL